MNEPLKSFAIICTVTQQSAAGAYVNGLWHDHGSPVTAAVAMVVQPANGRDLLILPEGERTRETIKIYTDVALNEASQTTARKGDRISYRGRMWEVNLSMDWDGTPLSHFKYLAQLVENDSA